MSMIDKYKNIFKGSLSPSRRPVAFIPKPQDVDYQRGYIRRYFVQKTQDSNSPIIEVSYDTFIKFQASPLYRVADLRWRLTGTESVVKDSNAKSIKISSTNIKKLNLYLPNLLQFHK